MLDSAQSESPRFHTEEPLLPSPRFRLGSPMPSSPRFNVGSPLNTSPRLLSLKQILPTEEKDVIIELPELMTIKNSNLSQKEEEKKNKESQGSVEHRLEINKVQIPYLNTVTQIPSESDS